MTGNWVELGENDKDIQIIYDEKEGYKSNWAYYELEASIEEYIVISWAVEQPFK